MTSRKTTASRAGKQDTSKSQSSSSGRKPVPAVAKRPSKSSAKSSAKRRIVARKIAPKLAYVVAIDALRGTVQSKDVPLVLRPRDRVRWVADQEFEIVLIGAPRDFRSAGSALKAKAEKKRYVVELGFAKISKLTRFEYEVRVGGKVIDPIIIIDPVRPVELA